MTSLAAGDVPQHPLALPHSVRPAIVAALTADLQRPVVLLAARSDRLLSVSEEIPVWLPGVRPHVFSEPNPLFYERAPWGAHTLRQRLSTLAALTASSQPVAPNEYSVQQPLLVACSARAIMTRTISPLEYLESCRWLTSSIAIRLDQLIEFLLGAGFAPASLVTEPGQFSRRGGILDLWPLAEPAPARLEFFGDEIETIRRFDPTTQRSRETLESLRVTPAREGLPRLMGRVPLDVLPQDPEVEGAAQVPYLEFYIPSMSSAPSGLHDYLPDRALILIDDRAALMEAITEFEEHAISLRQDLVQGGLLPADFPLPYLTADEIAEALAERHAVDLGFLAGQVEASSELSTAFSPGPRFGGQLKPLLHHLDTLTRSGHIAIIVSRQAPRLAELWSDGRARAEVVEQPPETLQPGALFFLRGALAEGWSVQTAAGLHFHLLTDAEIFGWARPRPRIRPRQKASAPETAFADLKSGDWVVHVDFGIGRLIDLVERSLDDLRREFLLIEYAEGDQLYVPIHQADRLTRYIGADTSPPTPSRLGTQEWARVKAKARQAVEEVAKELLELYATRNTVVGHAFSADGHWQEELEASFAYVETEDQMRGIDSVKRDMERALPMDRLICGDVGYGKTEVALRAAFKAVMDGKQVAILVPTTVLAQQHFNTFRERLAPFPVEVEMLSRFRSRQEAAAILERLASGAVDIVIGTHRLLQRDVRFSDLGLLVIDEEQRFGVTHKEHLKKMRTEVDVLTMTATPIPRTLYLALTGARDISTINTPPEERLPIITHVGSYDPRVVRHAILRELDRGGQVFFVHNRVQTIQASRHQLEQLVPEARLAVAHGQMPESELASVMERFTAAEVDVLLCTSIIESGLDIPNANTLIVDRADLFGLAQLYQLRGRVGRGASRAYAYFFRHPRFRSTDEALKRLETIAEHSQLGAGYSIAMLDLEMRGAGDILGTRQHGQIAAVGFHLYTRLLAEAVRRQRKGQEGGDGGAEQLQAPAEPLPIAIELPLDSSIPSEYIPDRNLRLQLYRRLAEIRSEQQLEAFHQELADRFGQPPEEVENLLLQLRVKILAARANVQAVLWENGQIRIRLTEELTTEDIPEFGDEIRRSKRGLWLARSQSRDWLEQLIDVLTRLAEKDRVIPSHVQEPAQTPRS
ncbi:MAG TPA: transcription-repair coupling factor [Anaerolineales bacterium]|nr:transcription-repair coupling factor [Anaerolineales bacterium]